MKRHIFLVDRRLEDALFHTDGEDFVFHAEGLGVDSEIYSTGVSKAVTVCNRSQRCSSPNPEILITL